MSDWEDTLAEKDRNFDFFVKGLKSLWSLLGDSRKKIVSVLILMIAVQLLSMVFPYLLKLIFDELPKISTEKKVNGYVIFLITALFVVKISQLAIRRFVQEPRFLKALISLESWWPVFAQKKLLELSISYHERQNTGEKIAKIEKGINRLVEVCCDLYWQFLPNVLFLTLNLIFIAVIDWKISLLFAAAFVPWFWMNRKFYNRFHLQWEKWDQMKEISSGYFCQSLINVKTVKNFVQEKKELNRFSTIRKAMESLDTNINMAEQKYFFVMNLCLDFFFVLSIAAGVFFVLYGKTTIGTLIFVIATGQLTLDYIWAIIQTYSRIMKRFVSVQSFKSLLDEQVDIRNNAEDKIPQSFQGLFDFQQVTFSYNSDQQKVLTDLSMRIFPRQMVALVGRSGAGKTTILRLLNRAYDLSQGHILLDNTEIKNFDLYWYRRLFAVVDQDVDIFDTTLRENIIYPFDDATDEQVDQALLASHLKETVSDAKKFVDGLQTKVGERGVKLSGGEKQRVGIARAYIALLNGAKVLLLDEATSSLDSEAEKAIQSMINDIRQKMNITIVAIAHRLSTVKKADVIFVIDDGKIIEQGSHERLLKQNGLYAHLAELQRLGHLVE